MLPPAAAAATAAYSGENGKMIRGSGGVGNGAASRSAESFIEAVPPVTSCSLLGGGDDELSTRCGTALCTQFNIDQRKISIYRGCEIQEI